MQADNDMRKLTMTWLLLNIPLMILFFAMMVGIPMWLVRKHPDTKPTRVAAPAVMRLPAREHVDADYRRAA
jgi:hypothetical protein